MFRKMRLKEIPETICISYTIISISAALMELFIGKNETTHTNTLTMLLWTVIAVFVLYIHFLFENLPPILMVIIQYVLAMGLVYLSVVVINLIAHETVSDSGYFDIFYSFTIPYVIGAIWYYISVFTYANKQNKLLGDIQEKKQK